MITCIAKWLTFPMFKRRYLVGWEAFWWRQRVQNSSEDCINSLEQIGSNNFGIVELLSCVAAMLHSWTMLRSICYYLTKSVWCSFSFRFFWMCYFQSVYLCWSCKSAGLVTLAYPLKWSRKTIPLTKANLKRDLQSSSVEKGLCFYQKQSSRTFLSFNLC